MSKPTPKTPPETLTEGDIRKLYGDSIGHWDLEYDKEYPMVIEKVTRRDCYDRETRGQKRQTCVHFVKAKKFLVLNPTNRDRIIDAIGSANVKNWPGQTITLYRDPAKHFGNDGCVRVKERS